MASSPMTRHPAIPAARRRAFTGGWLVAAILAGQLAVLAAVVAVAR